MGIKAGGGSKLPLGMGVNIPAHVQKKSLQNVNNPFAEKKEFRLGLYHIVEERHDYLICQGWNPNAKGTSAQYTPSAFQTINVAKPSLLQKTPWHGKTESLIVGGVATPVTFTYSLVGMRIATAGEVTEIQRITMDYFVGDTITAVEVRKNSAVDGCDTLTETGSRLTWVDLNFSGRCWAVSSG